MDGDPIDGVYGGQQVGRWLRGDRGRWTGCWGYLDEIDHSCLRACAGWAFMTTGRCGGLILECLYVCLISGS